MWNLLDHSRNFPSSTFRGSMVLDFGLKELGLRKDIEQDTILEMANLVQDLVSTQPSKAIHRFFQVWHLRQPISADHIPTGSLGPYSLLVLHLLSSLQQTLIHAGSADSCKHFL